MTRDDLGDATEVWVQSGEPSALDRGFLYGDGAFETLRLYDGDPAFLDRHLDRLDSALTTLEIDVDVDAENVRAAAEHLTEGFVEDDAYLRVTVTRGEREGLLEPTERQPTVVWMAKPLHRRRYPAADVESTDVRRPTGVAGRHKTLNYLGSVLARKQVDADEALMRDSRGSIASGSVSNVFTVEAGELVTPGNQVRRGVTRELVLDVAGDLGYETLEAEVDLGAAEEVFLTNTTWGVRPVGSVDGRSVSEREVTEELQEEYLERALGSAKQQ